VLNSKNATIEDLQFQLARACKVRKGLGSCCVPGAGGAEGRAEAFPPGLEQRLAALFCALAVFPIPLFPCETRSVEGPPPFGRLQGARALAGRGQAGFRDGSPEHGAFFFQAHNDMLQTLEAKLTSFGIPLDNLGFKPLESPVVGPALGQGPAGLVAVPT